MCEKSPLIQNSNLLDTKFEFSSIPIFRFDIPYIFFLKCIHIKNCRNYPLLQKCQNYDPQYVQKLHKFSPKNGNISNNLYNNRQITPRNTLKLPDFLPPNKFYVF